MSDFHASRPAIRQNASGLKFQDRNQTPRDIRICRIHLQCHCQLAFELFRD